MFHLIHCTPTGWTCSCGESRMSEIPSESLTSATDHGLPHAPKCEVVDLTRAQATIKRLGEDKLYNKVLIENAINVIAFLYYGEDYNVDQLGAVKKAIYETTDAEYYSEE